MEFFILILLSVDLAQARFSKKVYYPQGTGIQDFDCGP